MLRKCSLSLSYLIHVVDSARVPAAGHPVFSDCGQHHSFVEALLEPAVLAPVPLRLVDLTVAVRNAVVDALVLNGALEEAFASATKTMLQYSCPYAHIMSPLPLASDDTIVKTRGLVLADHADEWFLFFLFWWDQARETILKKKRRKCQ